MTREHGGRVTAAGPWPGPAAVTTNRAGAREPGEGQVP
jgi:hypothetical protein